ncbi:hypothetical protein ACRCRN_23535, partial [Pseudomonas aeruginosa]
MTEFMQILIFGSSLAMAYFLGATSSRKSSSEIRLIDKWPTAYIQFDSGMSQEDALRFIELAADSTPFGHSAHADPDTCSTIIRTGSRSAATQGWHC